VKDIGLAGQVACGSSHTLVVSLDGWTVWSFGGGDNGKLFYCCSFVAVFIFIFYLT